MTVETRDHAAENVRALMIFPLAPEWKQVLLAHGCTFGESDYGETVIFPEDTARTMLLSRNGRSTNCFRLLLPDGLELREVLDDEGTGNSWVLLVLSQMPMQGTRADHLQERTRSGGETDELHVIAGQLTQQEQKIVEEKHHHREGKEILRPEAKHDDERNGQEARAIIEKAQARVGLITVLTRCLENSDDLLAKIAAAEFRNDPNWRAFTKDIGWYRKAQRAIRRKKGKR